MMTLKDIESWVWRNRWAIVAAAVLSFSLLVSVRSCRDNASEADRLAHNIEALQDTIRSYATAQGKSISRINGLIADISELKSYNSELAALVDEYRNTVNSDPQAAVSAEAQIVMPAADTVYVVEAAEPLADQCFPFDFSDRWRKLAGRVWLENSSMGLHLDQEKVYLSLVAGLDDDYHVFVMTDNPYVEISSLSGFTVPKKKQPRWSISASAGMWGGYDARSGKLGYGPGLMIGVGYNLINF